MAAKTFLKSKLAICSVSFLLAHLTFAAPPRYEIIDLGTLGGDQSSASFVNDRGQIVGMAYNQQGNHRATLFDSTGNGNNIDLGTLGGINSWACSVNYIGQIMGSADNEQNNLRATLFDPNGSGKNIDLGTLGDLLSNALSINNRGQIVGYARNEQGYQRATLFDPTGGGKNIDLGTLGGIHSQAWYVNDRGQIVGKARIPRGYSHATLFDPTGGGNNIDLGTLGGSSSNACCINNLGQIVGWAANDWLDNRATLFDNTGDGKNIELGTLGGRLSWAEAINDLGQIVGAAENQLRDTRATLFDPTGSRNNIDLNTLIDPAYGWTLKYTDSINNHGWIVGTGINPAGESRAFLMKPLPRTIYVDDDATGANDGSSWADAFNYLQDALTAAWSGDEIHVAQGIYRPDQGAVVTPGDRDASFQLINGVTIKGGYAGYGQPDPNQRDTNIYETILSGDLNGNDVEVEDPAYLRLEPTRSENSYHVVIGSGTDETAVLDGFTITGGNGTAGGGMYNDNGSPTLILCTFRANSGGYDGSGGGMYNSNSNPTLTNCNFIGNAASWPGGGGMVNYTSSPTLINCSFVGNTANSAFYGGEGSGGAIKNWEKSSPTLINCVFIGNSAADFGGAIESGGNYTHTVSNPTLINCTIVGNLAGRWGGAMLQESGTLTLKNCILWNNTAPIGSMVYLRQGYQVDATVNISYSDIEGGQSGFYIEQGCTLNWGFGNIDADPLFIEPGYRDANGVWIDGDYHLMPDSPCIDAGDPNYVAEPNETDLDGRPRVLDGDNDGVLVVDMGAYEYRFTISAEARIVPQTINLASKGKWITCYLRLPEGYNVADIVSNSVLLERQIKAEQFSVDQQKQVATATFDREKVQSILNVGDIELTITGRLTDGNLFEGKDTIKVINKAGKN